MGAAASGMADKMAENQKKAMQKQMAMQASMGVAMARDNLYWIGGFYSVIASTAGMAFLKYKTVPLPLRIPLVIIPVASTFYADMAYGNKMERVRQNQHYILEKEKRWFNDKEVDEVLRQKALAQVNAIS